MEFKIMDDVQGDLASDDGSSIDALGGMGVEPTQTDSMDESEQGSLAKDSDPLSVKKRLGQQAKRHQREMRSMQDQIMQMQSQMGQQQQPQSNQNGMNQQYGQPAQNVQGMSIEEQIQRGVRYAMQAQEEQARQAKEAERMSHVHKQYARLNDEFDKASDKYDDFDDVVRGDAPFSPAIRDALLFVDNPSDVAYKLGKNRDELSRISQLHPLDQAREVNKLSFALMGGNNARASSAPGNNGARPMGNIKANPVNSQAVNDKTPTSVIRARMKAGTWK